MTRRTFLTMLLSTTGVLGAAGLLAPIVRYAYPTVQAVAVAKQKVATTAQPAAGGGELNFDYQDTPSSLVKLEDGTYAGVSRVCTHLECIIKWQGKDKRFFCFASLPLIYVPLASPSRRGLTMISAATRFGHSTEDM